MRSSRICFCRLLVSLALLLISGQLFATQAGPKATPSPTTPSPVTPSPTTPSPTTLESPGVSAAQVLSKNLGQESYLPELGAICLVSTCATFESQGKSETLWPWFDEDKPLATGVVHVVADSLVLNGNLGGRCTLREGSRVRFDPYGSPSEVLPLSQIRCEGHHSGQQLRFGGQVAGTRGTDFEIAVAEDGHYAIWVYEGAVEVSDRASSGQSQPRSFTLQANQGAIFFPDRDSPTRLETAQDLGEFEQFKQLIGSDRTVRGETRPEDAIARLMQRCNRLPIRKAAREVNAFASVHPSNPLLPWALFEIWLRGVGSGETSSVEGLADTLRRQYPDSQWTTLMELEVQEAALQGASQGDGRNRGKRGAPRGQ